MNKRILIYTHGIKLISEKGFTNTTVQDIVNSAKISVGSFYNYYKDKNDLLFYIFEYRLLSLIKKLDELILMKTTPMEKIENYFQYLVNEDSALKIIINEESFNLYRMLTDDRKAIFTNLNKAIESKFTSIVSEGQALNIIKPTSPLIIYSLINSLTIASYNKYDLVNEVPIDTTKSFFINTILKKK